MKSLSLSTGFRSKLSKASVIMLIYSSLLSAEETAPSMSFLEFLGQEENESWIEPALELSNDSTNESEQIEDRSAEEDSNETN